MRADRRLYMIIYNHESNSADQEIWDNTQRLIKKSNTKYPGTVTKIVGYPVTKYFINTTWNFLNNDLTSKVNAITELNGELKKLTNQSELILRGHGNVKERRLSRIAPEILARGLVECGLGVNCRINITGCNLGRNPQTAGTTRGTASVDVVSADSFAEVFARTLYEETDGDLRPQIHARTSTVTVVSSGSKETWLFDESVDDRMNKQPHSKIILQMQTDGSLNRRFAY